LKVSFKRKSWQGRPPARKSPIPAKGSIVDAHFLNNLIIDVMGNLGSTSLKNLPIALILTGGTKIRMTITIIVQPKKYSMILSILICALSKLLKNY